MNSILSYTIYLIIIAMAGIGGMIIELMTPGYGAIFSLFWISMTMLSFIENRLDKIESKLSKRLLPKEEMDK